MANTVLKKIYEIQNEIGTVAKDSDNPFSKSRYLSLGGILDALNPLLFKHELMLTWEVQPVKDDSANYAFVATFTDMALEAMPSYSFPFTAPSDNSMKSAVQGYGSATTYIRRYGLGMIFNLETAEDPDSIQELSGAVKNTMVEYINDGKYQLVEKQMKKYSMPMSERVELMRLIREQKVKNAGK